MSRKIVTATIALKQKYLVSVRQAKGLVGWHTLAKQTLRWKLDNLAQRKE